MFPLKVVILYIICLFIILDLFAAPGDRSVTSTEHLYAMRLAKNENISESNQAKFRAYAVNFYRQPSIEAINHVTLKKMHLGIHITEE